ncbi:MAG: hypothetical protein IJ841_08185 [Prevotella sp.]|nr:hypothetical protein [Prevotella sp.]
MDEEVVGLQEVPLKLEKAYTFFMVPFYFDASPLPEDGNQTWEKETENVSFEGENGEVLYSYIMDFLQGQMRQTECQGSHLDIYRLRVDKDSSWYKDFWARFVNYTSIAYVSLGRDASKQEVIRPIRFQLLSGDENGFKAPHLFIYQEAQIGILTFCVELAEKPKLMSDLKLLNYGLHKINQPLCRLVCPQLQINANRVFADEQARIQAEETLRTVRTYIGSYDEAEAYSPYQEFTWSMKALVSMWLQDVGHQLFSTIRMHAFVYCQIDDSEKEVLTEQQLLPDLLKLSRCVNDKYLLPVDDLLRGGATLKTFDNIYMASSVEGTAIMAVARKANKGYISQMDGNIKLRYLWVYMLAVIQRYTLLNMNRQLMKVESDNDEKALWEVLKTIKNVRVKCYYTDVSPYTQHGQFYQLCCRNLHVKDTFDELDQKTTALNMTISHDVQKLLEQQQALLKQQRQDEERREKEQEKKLRLAEQKAESGQRRLNLVVGILTVFQVAEVIFSFTENWGNRIIWVSLTFLVCFFLLYLVMKWEQKDIPLIRWARSIYFSKLWRSGRD